MQPKTQSLIEQLCNVGSGFAISLTYWQLFIIPQIEGKELTFLLNLSVTAQFTIISIIRGYVWRRYFNGLLIKQLSRVV